MGGGGRRFLRHISNFLPHLKKANHQSQTFRYIGYMRSFTNLKLICTHQAHQNHSKTDLVEVKNVFFEEFGVSGECKSIPNGKSPHIYLYNGTFWTDYRQIKKAWIIMWHLILPSYSSKDAPRPPFSNARRFISFGQLLMPLRAHLWTVALRKIRKIREYASFFEKNIQNLVTLIRCRRVINQLVLPV